MDEGGDRGAAAGETARERQGAGVEPVPGEGQRLSACQMAAQGPAWFMV